MKIIFEIILLIVVVIILIYLLFCFAPNTASQSSQQNLINSVCIKENCFNVEVVKTETERERGLMYRAELDKNNGMLFIFDKVGFYPFWMKNTLIPLDMMWIDSNYKIVFIGQNEQPCKSLICPPIIPLAKAKYVLEINAGLSQEFGFNVGDEAKFVR